MHASQLHSPIHPSGEPRRTTKSSAKLVIFPVSESAPLIQDAFGSPNDQTNLRRVAAYTSKTGDFLLKSIALKLKSAGEPFRIYDEVLHFTATISSIGALGTKLMPWGELGPLFPSVDDQLHIDSPVKPPSASVMIFDYGVIVFWGISEQLEQCVADTLNAPQFHQLETPHKQEFPPQKEVLHYYIDESSSTTGRVYGDVIVIRVDDFPVRLTISHALAQSVKLGVYEDMLSMALESTWQYPVQLSLNGRLLSTTSSKRQVNKKIGELFLLRMQLNLMSHVMDTPEIFWTEVQWEGLYKSARTYLEIPQRIEVLNQRMHVISDLLDMLRQHLSTIHDQLGGQVYDNFCYNNGVASCFDSKTNRELSWKVSSKYGLGNVEMCPAASTQGEFQDGPPTPKGYQMWKMSLSAPSNPSHTIYCNSKNSLDDIHHQLEATCTDLSSMNLVSTTQAPQNVWGILKDNARQVQSLKEVRDIEKRCLREMVLFFCPVVKGFVDGG